MNKRQANCRILLKKDLFRLSNRFAVLLNIILNIFVLSAVHAINKTSTTSGNWSNSSCWSPAGTPTVNDDVTIATGHTITVNNNSQVHHITISADGKLTFKTNRSLTISGNISVNGTMNMNGGDVNLQNDGSSFILGSKAVFIWSPGNNSSQGATLFGKGVENFNPTSTLIIKKWYDYTVPLGEVVTGNFGNLVVNTPAGSNSIIEWNQKNYFESHKISGTLTIEDGSEMSFKKT